VLQPAAGHFAGRRRDRVRFRRRHLDVAGRGRRGCWSPTLSTSPAALLARRHHAGLPLEPERQPGRLPHAVSRTRSETVTRDRRPHAAKREHAPPAQLLLSWRPLSRQHSPRVTGASSPRATADSRTGSRGMGFRGSCELFSAVLPATRARRSRESSCGFVAAAKPAILPYRSKQAGTVRRYQMLR
jgi:hypothetical protein